MLARYPVWLAAAFALALSFSADTAGYTIGASDARADAARTTKRLQAQSRKPASALGISQCGSTVMAVVARGDGSLILMTAPARDADKINGIAHSLPEGRVAVAVLPCPITGMST